MQVFPLLKQRYVFETIVMQKCRYFFLNSRLYAITMSGEGEGAYARLWGSYGCIKLAMLGWGGDNESVNNVCLHGIMCYIVLAEGDSEATSHDNGYDEQEDAEKI